MSTKEKLHVISNEIGHFDYEWAVGLNRHPMKLIGLWPEENTGRIRLQNGIHVVSFVTIAVFGLLFPQLYALKLVIHQLTLVADNIIPCVASMVSVAKIIFLHLHQRNLRFVMSCIKSDYMEQKNEWERKLMLDEAKLARYFTICGYAMVMSSIIGVFLGPMVGLSFRMINNITDRGDRYFPEQTYYPYHFERTPYFEITYVVHTFAAVIVTFCFSSPVIFFNTIVIHNCGLLAILSNKITNLKVRNEENEFDNTSQIGHQEFRAQLQNLVQSHIRIITIVNNIEDSYKSLILAHGFGLSTMMCCLSFRMLNAINGKGDGFTTSQFILLTVMLGTVILQTFLYCFAGEKLAVRSEELHRNIYNTKWYNWKPKQSMSLMFMLLRSKEPLQLTAGKVVSLNLQSFANFLKTSAGYISVLYAVTDK